LTARRDRAYHDGSNGIRRRLRHDATVSIPAKEHAMTHFKAGLGLFTLMLTTTAFSAEKAPKMEPILNGKDLTGWKKPKNPESWQVKDGVLTVRNNKKKKGENLSTKRVFRNFICQVEFKFGEGLIDSGIFIRNNKEQIQIGVSGSLKRDMTASPYIPGKGYPVEAKDVKKLLKMKDWNTLKIRAVGNKYTSWLNGKEVMNYTSASAAKEGPLGIQLHGNRTMMLTYRNFVAADLPDEPAGDE
jgi:hypothetical protein